MLLAVSKESWVGAWEQGYKHCSTAPLKGLSHMPHTQALPAKPGNKVKLHLCFSLVNCVRMELQLLAWSTGTRLIACFWRQDGKMTRPQALRCITLSSQFHAHVMLPWDIPLCVLSHQKANAHSSLSPIASFLQNMRANQNVAHVFTHKLPR